MELSQIESFVAVAAQLHFGRAAQVLGISQSSLSQRIRRLEEELGVELLARSSREVRLTEAGRLLLSGGRRLVGEEQDLREKIKSTGAGGYGRLRLGVVPSMLTGLIPELLQVLHSRAPGIEVDLRPMGHSAQVRALLRGNIDVSISRGPSSEPGIEWTEIMSEPVGIITRRDGRVPASADPVQFVAESPLPICVVRRAVNPRLYDAWTRTLENAGISTRSIVELSDIHCVASYVLAGLAITIQTPSFLDLSPSELLFLRVPSSLIVGQMKVFWAAQQRPEALSPFIDAAKSAGAARVRHWQRLQAV